MTDEIKVTYSRVEQVIGDIRALKAMATEYASIDPDLAQSKGSGADALQNIAESLRQLAKSLEALLERSASRIESSGIEFEETDSERATHMEGIS